MIKIGVVGANGKMGSEVVKLAISDPELELVCAVDANNIGQNIYNDVYIEGDLEAALKIRNVDVVVDFTQPKSVYENVLTYIENGVKSVIGTTGLSNQQISKIQQVSDEKNVGCFIAPNFSIGAILMMKFASEASKYFSNAEIIEYHHNQKKDAPSGTSIKTAQLMMKNNNNFKLGNCEETETINGARGGNYSINGNGNIQIHAVRMPGFVASQEVIFGADGQILKIHHDTINRECYMSGVKLAVEHIFKNNNFVYGLENIL